MVFGLFKSGKENVEELIARKDYGRAGEVLRAQLKETPGDVRARQQLADVLAFQGRGEEAVAILAPLADEFAADGFVAKAIAILKKIQKIEPDRRDVEEKLALLIGEQTGGVVPSTGSFPRPTTEDLDLGFEEVGEATRTGKPSLSAPEPKIDVAPADPLPEVKAAPAPPSSPEFTLPPPPPPLELGAVSPPAPAASAAPAPPPGEETVTELPGDSTTVRKSKAEERRWREIAATPLFTDFRKDELIAVIRGLKLRHFADGDIIVTENEPGDSLFVITTGRVKVFTRNPKGQHVPLASLVDGDFFGEVSVLTGKPRTATITAASECEILELDKTTLDEIAEKHPRVRKVMEQFLADRAGKTIEAMVQSLK